MLEEPPVPLATPRELPREPARPECALEASLQDRRSKRGRDHVGDDRGQLRGQGGERLAGVLGGEKQRRKQHARTALPLREDVGDLPERPTIDDTQIEPRRLHLGRAEPNRFVPAPVEPGDEKPLVPLAGQTTRDPGTGIAAVVLLALSERHVPVDGIDRRTSDPRGLGGIASPLGGVVRTAIATRRTPGWCRLVAPRSVRRLVVAHVFRSVGYPRCRRRSPQRCRSAPRGRTRACP